VARISVSAALLVSPDGGQGVTQVVVDVLAGFATRHSLRAGAEQV
jgi:hypothetical protein